MPGTEIHVWATVPKAGSSAYTAKEGCDKESGWCKDRRNTEGTECITDV